ncbi:MAG: response regulator transcription factor [Gemmataceae bacterium]|nr:response regulator transcription factor [Gemmataceae bacterium]
MPRAKAEVKEKPARILIVDDHPAVREGLAIRISRHADMAVCGEAADVAEALQMVASARPDVAIIDIALKTGNGIDLIKRIKAHNPTVRMLVLSMYNETLYAERALRAGALGYITKGSDTDKVIDAIRRVRHGKVYLSEPMAEELLSRVVGGEARHGDGPPVENLSDRELEVFELIGQGMSTHQIADKMRLSPKTVETYRSRIKEKLNVKYSTELMQRAVQWVMEKRS